MGAPHLAVGIVVPVLAVLGVAAVWDLRTRRVPNWLTIGGSLAGLAVNVALGHERGALASLTGWALGLALLLIPYLLGAIGGGDVKMLGVAGAWGGPAFAFATLFFGALIGGVIALIALVQERRAQRFSTLQRVPEDDRGGAPRGRVASRKRYLPYAPAIAIGGLIAYLVG